VKKLSYFLRAEVEGVKTRSEIQSMFDAAGVNATVGKGLDRYDYEDGGCETSFSLRIDVDASACESQYASQAALELGMSEEAICDLARVEGVEGPRMPDSPVVRWAK